MKRLFWVLLGLCGLLLVTAVLMVIAAIWTGDSRWGVTAIVVGFVGCIGAFATATYPGWD